MWEVSGLFTVLLEFNDRPSLTVSKSLIIAKKQCIRKKYHVAII